MTVNEITEYLNQKELKEVDIQGVSYKMTGTDKETLDKYVSYITTIGRRY